MKKSYKVLGNIKHDGKGYSEGSTIELNDDEVEDLRKAGAIGDETVAQAPSAPTIPTDPAERLAAIVAAIGNLDKENSANWTADNKPQVPAIVAITGWPVSAAERNDAWASMQPAD